VHAYPAPLRWACAALLAASGAVPTYLLYRVLVATDTQLGPGALLRAVLAFAALPALAAWLVRRALVAEVEIADGELTVRVAGQTTSVPLASIAAVEPWRLPLPEPGVALRLATGGRVPFGIGVRDPSALLEALARSGVADAAAQRGRASVLWARARAAEGAWRWRDLAVKYPLFALFPAGVLFHAQQQIAYGGALGQYHLEGAAAWAQAAAAYWVTVTVYLVLYASAWRLQVELASLLGALAAPRLGEAVAFRTRHLAELVARIAFYAGVPLLLAVRLGG